MKAAKQKRRQKNPTEQKFVEKKAFTMTLLEIWTVLQFSATIKVKILRKLGYNGLKKTIFNISLFNQKGHPRKQPLPENQIQTRK